MERSIKMKKVICLVLVIMVLLAANALPVYAQGGGHGGGHGGGGHGGGGHGGGHGGGGHGHGHSSFSGSFWIGPGWGWGGWGPWWGYYPYYYPYYSPYYYPYYYSESPAVIERQPRAYTEPSPQSEDEYYWYFCPDSRNYYPYVKHCPSGWLKVVPRQTPSDWKE